MDECLRQHPTRPHAESRGATGVGEPNRAAQGGDAGLDGPGGDRGRARLDDGLDGGLGRHADLLTGSFPHRRLDDVPWCNAELRVEQLRPCGVLLFSGSVRAGQAVQPDQQRLVVLVERAHRGRAYGEAPRTVERPSGQQAHRSLVQDALGGGREATAFGEQPRLEGGRAAQRDAVEQLGVKADHLDGVRPGRAREDCDVHEGVLRESEDDGVSVEDGAVAETTPDLGEAPPQRPQRVVRLAEQQPRQLAPGRGCLAQQQVGQQCPALPAPKAVRHSVRPLDARPTQEPDAQRHQLSRAAAVSRRGSGKSSQYW